MPKTKLILFTRKDSELSKKFAKSLSDEELKELAENPSPKRYNELAITWAEKNGYFEWAEKLKTAYKGWVEGQK